MKTEHFMSIEAERFEQSNNEKQKLEKFENLVLTPEQCKDISLNAEIKKKFEETNPDMVYVEGMERINNEKDQVKERLSKATLEQTKEEGENVFTPKLGIDAGTDFESLEPERSQEIEYLLAEGFSKKDIEPYFRRFRTESGWEADELSTFRNKILSELDVSNGRKCRAQVNPIPRTGRPQTVLNEVAMSLTNFRDRHIFERIAEGLKKYNKLFVVYCDSHAIMQEPALRALLAEKQ